jgi:hypothetical protein
MQTFLTEEIGRMRAKDLALAAAADRARRVDGAGAVRRLVGRMLVRAAAAALGCYESVGAIASARAGVDGGAPSPTLR